MAPRVAGVLLYHWHGNARNFGDELNTLVWPRLLPDFFDDDPSEIFLGIGSVLEAPHPTGALKVTAGAGYGGYAPVPMLDASWVIHWVRGPRTARMLGLPESRGLGDPAMLLLQAGLGGSVTKGATPGTIGFMPHFESLGRGAWHEAAVAAGVRLIDPRRDPAAVIAAITDCRVLLSEALHGVIVADALRVPWIALRPLAAVHRAKWQDWAATLDLHVAFHSLVASSLAERLYASPVAASRSGRVVLDRSAGALRRLARCRFIDAAARALTEAATNSPQLSHAVALERCQTRMLDRLNSLRRDPRRAG
jgi:succinoglycan biosynthesis protein ExoV